MHPVFSLALLFIGACLGLSKPLSHQSSQARGRFPGLAMSSSSVEARSCVTSFESRVFVPLGGSADPVRASPHYQTIIGSEILPAKLFGRVFPRTFDTTVERIKTPDNDWFDIEKSMNIDDDAAAPSIVVVLHGLESNTRGPLVTKMATAFLRDGFAFVLVSFRGCGGEENATPGGYHLGFTDDLDLVTRILRERYPKRDFYISGFSLGGNVTLKFLGEQKEAALERGIKGAAVTCVPFDPIASQGKLDVGINRILYSENFLSTLKKKAERQIERFPGSFKIERVRRCNTIGEFDDEFISAIYGFAGKTDYYRKCGSKWWLSSIRVPTIAINARDDPFIEEDSLPTRVDVAEAPVRLVYHDKGGHCGFIANSVAEEDRVCGFLAGELSRALVHIRSFSSQHGP